MRLAAFAFIAVASLAAADSAPEKNFTLENLQQAANYLGVRIEKPKTKLLKCDPNEETAKAWTSGKLHALLDAKVQVEGGRFERNPSQMVKRAKNCSRDCTCNAFAAVLENTELSMNKHPMYKQLSKVLDRETKKQDRLACAKAYKAFCGGSLEAYLKGGK